MTTGRVEADETSGLALLATLGLVMLAAPMSVHADGFPFGHELMLDASPMRGSKKVPILDIGDAGNASDGKSEIAGHVRPLFGYTR
jgi:hypothetical protein